MYFGSIVKANNKFLISIWLNMSGYFLNGVFILSPLFGTHTMVHGWYKITQNCIFSCSRSEIPVLKIEASTLTTEAGLHY